MAISTGLVDLNSNGNSEVERRQFRDAIMVEVVRMVYACFTFSELDSFSKIMKTYKIPQLMLSVTSMDKMLISNLMNIITEFDYADPSLLKCLLKFASPDDIIPDLDPIFLAAEKYGKHKMNKLNKSFRLGLRFDYKNKFIEPKLMESLRIKNLDKSDLFAQMEQKKLTNTEN